MGHILLIGLKGDEKGTNQLFGPLILKPHVGTRGPKGWDARVLKEVEPGVLKPS